MDLSPDSATVLRGGEEVTVPAEELARYRSRGATVVAVGAPGSDAALETADGALMGDELGKLPYVLEFSRRGSRVIRQNIGASLALKVGLAAGVPLGVVSLILAVVVGDMGASLGVTANSLRLARLRP